MIIEKAVNDIRGMVIKPYQAKNLVVHETPRLHGESVSGIIL